MVALAIFFVCAPQCNFNNMFFVVSQGPMKGIYLSRRDAERATPAGSSWSTCSTFKEANLCLSKTELLAQGHAQVQSVYVGVAERRHKTVYALYYGFKDPRNETFCEHDCTAKAAHLKALCAAMCKHVNANDSGTRLRIISPSVYAVNCLRRYAQVCSRSDFRQPNGSLVPYHELLNQIVHLKENCNVGADHICLDSGCEPMLKADSMARAAAMTTMKNEV